MNSKNYTFDFIIPQGPTGPTGPTSKNIPGLSSYGGKYNYSVSTINLSSGCQEQVLLNDSLFSKNVDYKELNSIIIEQDGIYEITYNLNLSVPSKTILTATVRENGNDIISTVSTKILEAGISSVFCMNTIYMFQKGSVVDLALATDTDVEVSVANNASLLIKQLD